MCTLNYVYNQRYKPCYSRKATQGNGASRFALLTAILVHSVVVPSLAAKDATCQVVLPNAGQHELSGCDAYTQLSIKCEICETLNSKAF